MRWIAGIALFGFLLNLPQFQASAIDANSLGAQQRFYRVVVL